MFAGFVFEDESEIRGDTSLLFWVGYVIIGENDMGISPANRDLVNSFKS